MGIQGLLPFLKKIHSPVNISQYEGCTVAIDAYCWLHRGAFACAEKLALGEKTDQYVFYCMKYINYLLSKDIKPIMVFDGCRLPSKKEVEKARRERREVNRKKAAQFLREGKRSEARDCLQKCIDVTPQMALELINACREKNVDCLVAPYEADAQLAYLSKTGIAQVIITEDSDLLLFGCERILFKMDNVGNGVMIERRRLHEVMALKNGFYTFDKFRYMCILSGCDYLPSLVGIGLVKANKVFKITQQTDVRMVLKKLPTYIKLTEPVTQEYMDGFVRADNTFLYQLVFDPCTTRLMPLTPYPAGVTADDMRYAGSYKPQHLAYQMALGNIDIYTEQKMAAFEPSRDLKPVAGGSAQHRLSIWHSRYQPMKDLPLKEKQVKSHESTEGREVTVNTRPLVKAMLKKRRSSEVENEEMLNDGQLSDIYAGHESSSKRPRLSPADVTSQSPQTTIDDGQTNDTATDAPSNNHISPDAVSSSLVSPTACNKFAIMSQEVKEKFDVNAVKVQVKSRFFARNPKQSCLLDRLSGLDQDVVLGGEEGGHVDTVDGVRDVKVKEESCIVAECSDSSDDSIRKHHTHHGNSRNKAQSSALSLTKTTKETRLSAPKSVFSWTKFTFLKKSDSDPSNATSVNKCNVPFINVSPLTNDTRASPIVRSDISDDSHKPMLDSSARVKRLSPLDSMIVSQPADGIEGACSSAESHDVIDLSQDEDYDVTMSSSCPAQTGLPTPSSSCPAQTRLPTPKVMCLSQPSTQKHKTARGSSCRVSGLRTPPLRQASMRAMLAKFASSSSHKLNEPP